jgi:hypothetical protein
LGGGISPIPADGISDGIIELRKLKRWKDEQRMIKGQITKKEFMAFHRLNRSQSKMVDAIDMIIVCLMLLVLVITFASEENPLSVWIYYLPVILILLMIPVLLWVVMPLMWRRIYEQDNEIKLPFEIELGEKAIHFSNEIGKTTRPWTHYKKWKENNELLILYQTDRHATPLPKRIFTAEELAFLYDRLGSHNIPKARPISTVSCVVYAAFGLLLLVVLTAFCCRVFGLIMAE